MCSIFYRFPFKPAPRLHSLPGREQMGREFTATAPVVSPRVCQAQSAPPPSWKGQHLGYRALAAQHAVIALPPIFANALDDLPQPSASSPCLVIAASVGAAALLPPTLQFLRGHAFTRQRSDLPTGLPLHGTAHAGSLSSRSGCAEHLGKGSTGRYKERSCPASKVNVS